ncbi:hypothetical protein [Zymobacter sp. IVIA_12111.31 C1]|uniref:hypothetical protein n=1 Tax=Zymobacter sp. IVIA_12111.31 C1 TaxID=3394854 RepID=UPI0039C41818
MTESIKAQLEAMAEDWASGLHVSIRRLPSGKVLTRNIGNGNAEEVECNKPIKQGDVLFERERIIPSPHGHQEIKIKCSKVRIV